MYDRYQECWRGERRLLPATTLSRGNRKNKRPIKQMYDHQSPCKIWPQRAPLVLTGLSVSVALTRAAARPKHRCRSTLIEVPHPENKKPPVPSSMRIHYNNTFARHLCTAGRRHAGWPLACGVVLWTGQPPKCSHPVCTCSPLSSTQMRVSKGAFGLGVWACASTAPAVACAALGERIEASPGAECTRGCIGGRQTVRSVRGGWGLRAWLG